jgi:hypothetical protein
MGAPKVGTGLESPRLLDPGMEGGAIHHDHARPRDLLDATGREAAEGHEDPALARQPLRQERAGEGPDLVDTDEP